MDLTEKILVNGMKLKGSTRTCHLCGRSGGLTKKCAGCRKTGCYFHPTCARQAGFTVKPIVEFGKSYMVGCIEHSETVHSLRARIENLVVEETYRLKTVENPDDPSMTYTDAAQLLSWSVQIMRTLGWAWRWEEWWVEKNYRWECYLPYLNEDAGETPDDYTDEEKRVFHSTEASRRADSRDCRLVDFSAALRNRNYDTPGGYDNDSLCRALKAILDKKSIVGPLKDFEKQILMEWLPRAYRSESKNLGFGENKMEIGDAEFCYFGGERCPKFELGDRPLPGKIRPGVTSEPLTTSRSAGCIHRRETSKKAATTSAQPLPGKKVPGNGPRSRPEDAPAKHVQNDTDSRSQRRKRRAQEQDETPNESIPVAATDQNGQSPKKRATHEERQAAPKGTPLVANLSQAIVQGIKGNSRDKDHSNEKQHSNGHRDLGNVCSKANMTKWMTGQVSWMICSKK